ncbi:hypothetical protein Droror1_Dr00028043 [Drosera rotundifolia]
MLQSCSVALIDFLCVAYLVLHSTCLWRVEPCLFAHRRSFGSVLDVIPLADSVTKLTARCEMCGKLAHFTLRQSDETKTELIGGADKYMPVCRQHYISGQVVIGARRTVLQEKVQFA